VDPRLPGTIARAANRRPLLARAAGGIEFTGQTAAAAAPQLLAIGDSAGIDRLHHILALLDILGAAPPAEAQLLASPWTPPHDKGGTDDLIDDALNYLFTNSAREIKLADVAARAAMSESSFSRYFRRSAGQSFSDTVRKLRLAHACQLLENTDEPISTICHRTGYQNLSNFNRQFRREYGITPGQYRRIHQHPELVLAGSNPAQPEP
jgi:AraC-like DNA-binding protein